MVGVVRQRTCLQGYELETHTENQSQLQFGQVFWNYVLAARCPNKQQTTEPIPVTQIPKTRTLVKPLIRPSERKYVPSQNRICRKGFETPGP